jgi:MFS family permease
MVGQGLGILLGALAGVILTRTLAPEQLDAWGWRLPFLFGLLIGPVGLYIRRHLEETDEFGALRSSSPPSLALGTLLRTHLQAVTASFLLVICATSAAYVEVLYMPTYAKTQLALPLTDAFAAQMLALAWMILLIPLFGILSDRIGRRPVLMVAALSHFLLPYPLFAWMQAEPSFLRLLGVQVAMCSMVAVLFGPFSTVLAEQFPAGVRSTGTAIAYNLAVTLFGGFAPFTVTWLIRATGSQSSPAFYLMFGAAAGLTGTFLLRERPQLQLNCRIF